MVARFLLKDYVQNKFGDRLKAINEGITKDGAIPWATYTDQEVARVGLNETDAKEKGIAFELTRYGIDDLDRAIADSEDHGFV